MKKFFALLLVLCLIPLNTLACDVLLPKDEGTKTAAESAEYIIIKDKDEDCSRWAVEADSRELCGIKSPDEKLELKKPYAGPSKYLRGNAQGGMIRVPGKIRVACIADQTAGLYQFGNVQFRISAELVEFVTKVLQERVGCVLCAEGISAATLWWIDGDLSHIFWPDEIPVIPVIEVIFNGGEFSTWIYAGDFNGDGIIELGFKFGIPFPPVPKVTPEPEPEVTPEPEPEATEEPAPVVTPKPSQPTVKPQTQPKCEQKSTKICFGIEIDIKAWVKGCITLFKGACKGK